MVARSPNATHESIGQTKVPPPTFRLATIEFFRFSRKYFRMMKLDITFTDIICPFVLVPKKNSDSDCLLLTILMISCSEQIIDWRTTQNWDGPPIHQPWVVHCATQDFAFSAALTMYVYVVTTGLAHTLRGLAFYWHCNDKVKSCIHGTGI